ncbi:hypothetical protein ACEWY4_009859 [Coilia grayii]|uniref:EF-hand domain-containing protein n=1 Tax=Coilia grayii TaxID=363190 RepID=A0ABD1K7N9_9TELE
MSEYNKLKSMLLDMQSKGLKQGDKSYGNGMEQKRALVDTMFKYLDLNADGRLGSEELAQISTKEHLEDSLLECSMQDLIRYDDYNNDSHLTLHEFYTAFRLVLLGPRAGRRTQGQASAVCQFPLSADTCAAPVKHPSSIWLHTATSHHGAAW